MSVLRSLTLAIAAAELLMAPLGANAQDGWPQGVPRGEGERLAPGVPRQIGQCRTTTVALIGGRVTPRPDREMGYTMIYRNGMTQVDYSVYPGVLRSRVGDRVRLCVVGLPLVADLPHHRCPPGDERGYMYRATNLRTHLSWTSANSAHSCAGA
jgi:hypothetical protein